MKEEKSRYYKLHKKIAGFGLAYPVFALLVLIAAPARAVDVGKGINGCTVPEALRITISGHEQFKKMCDDSGDGWFYYRKEEGEEAQAICLGPEGDDQIALLFKTRDGKTVETGLQIKGDVEKAGVALNMCRAAYGEPSRLKDNAAEWETVGIELLFLPERQRITFVKVVEKVR